MITGAFSQAHALQQHIAQLPEPLNVEAVIVSPLSRALQTAVGAFGGTLHTEGTAQPLMIKQDHILVRAFFKPPRASAELGVALGSARILVSPCSLQLPATCTRCQSQHAL